MPSGARHWAALLRRLGLERFLEDDRFDFAARGLGPAVDELQAAISGALSSRPKEEVYHALAEDGVPVGVFSTVADLFESRQLEHRGFFEDVPTAGGPVALPGLPFPADAGPPGPPPRLGEHNHLLSAARRAVGVLPLQGVRVVDLTWAGAGPYASLQLGWLGAEVIKVEWPARPDVSRAGFYRRRDSAVSPQFNDLNLNKLSLAADLAASDGAALLRRLVSVSDVLTASYRPGVLERLGFDYASLRRVRPDIIVATVSSAGQTGPESRYAGFASIFSVQGGLGTLTGYPDAAPAALGDSVDLRVGAALVFGVLAALYERRKTGRGRLVDISAREVVSNALGAQIADFSMNGHVAERSGQPPRRRPRPRSLPLRRRRRLGQHRRLRGHGLRRPLRRDRPRRHAGASAGAEVDAAISAWTSARPPEEAARLLQEAGVAAAPYRSARHVAADPHLAARGAFVGVPQEDLGEQAVMRPPWRFEGAPPPPLAPAAPLGHHNDFIIEELLGGAAEREEEPQP